MTLGSDTPREVVLAAGAWAGERLHDDGFEWLPKKSMLRRTVGTLCQEIRFEPSSRNRRTGPITVLTTVAMADSSLGPWRRAHPDLVTRQDDFVCGHYLGYAAGDNHSRGRIDLSHPSARERHLEDWLSLVRAHALPWFSEAADPDRVTGSRAADMTPSPAWIVEWLASLGRTDVVPGFVETFLRRHRGWKGAVRRGQALAAEGGRLGEVADWPMELGWVAARVTAASDPVK